LRLDSIPIVEIGGVRYREFILDINEDKNSAGGSYLSLDKFKLYLADVGSLNNFDESTYTLSGTAPDGSGSYVATKIYDMDGLKDSSIGMDYALNSGSGKGVDLVARIPDAFFKTADGSDYVAPYVYLYSSFGEVGTNNNPDDGTTCKKAKTHTCTNLLPTGDFGHSAGFEEWATRRHNPAPEPGILFLLSLGAIALGVSKGRLPRFGKSASE